MKGLVYVSPDHRMRAPAASATRSSGPSRMAQARSETLPTDSPEEGVYTIPDPIILTTVVPKLVIAVCIWAFILNIVVKLLLWPYARSTRTQSTTTMYL